MSNSSVSRRPTAESDTLRTKGGGITRGIIYDIRELPAGVGGPGSPLLTTVAGTTPISTVPTNAADLAPVTSTDSLLGISGTIPFGAGTPIPQFDPTLTGSLNYNHQTTPQTSLLTTGANTLTGNTFGGNLGFNQAFSSGTDVSVGFNSARISSNSARTEYNPYTNGSFGITVTQPLLQGLSVKNNRRFIRVSKNEERISDELFRQQLLDTLSSVVRLYWDLVSLNEDVRVKQQALELAQKLFQDNQAQVEVGTLAPIEVKRAQAEVARSRQDLTNSTGLIQQQELILKNVLTRRGNGPDRQFGAHHSIGYHSDPSAGASSGCEPIGVSGVSEIGRIWRRRRFSWRTPAFYWRDRRTRSCLGWTCSRVSRITGSPVR